MEKKYLIINTGSTSKKYSFYEGDEKIYTAHFEMILMIMPLALFLIL